MIDFNLLPWRLRLRQRQKNRKIFLGIVFLFFVLAFFGIVHVFHVKHKIVSKRQQIQSRVFYSPMQLATKNVPLNVSDFLISDERIASTHLLNETPLQQLKWAGYFVQKNITTAFLKSPTGEIMAVIPGDTVGAEHANIIAINERQIILTLNHKIIKIPRNNAYVVSV